jgi:hypothetical protein
MGSLHAGSNVMSRPDSRISVMQDSATNRETGVSSGNYRSPVRDDEMTAFKRELLRVPAWPGCPLPRWIL